MEGTNQECEPVTDSRALSVIRTDTRRLESRKLFKQRTEADYRAQRARESQQRRSVQSAAKAALRRLEVQGFPGAVELADSKRKKRAAWFLCEVPANRPHGETGMSRYYLFSTDEVADDGGRSVTAAHSQDEIVAALNRLG